MAPSKDRPNILVILSDQLRRHALGVYGDPNISTPNIDALASHGVRFDSACATFPVCVPFRFTLMTGHYAHTRLVPAIEWRMSPAERTLADEFNEAGYETIYVGKWHLYGGQLHMPGYSAKRVNREPVPRLYQGRWKNWYGFELRNEPYDTCYFIDDDPTPRPIEKYQTDGLFDIAMQHLTDKRDRQRPFVCVVSVEPPHDPYIAPPELEDKWRDREIQLPPNFQADGDELLQKRLHNRRMYYAMVENLDQNVGQMVDYLQENQLLDNTIVIFMSDHGELSGSHGHRAKQHPYEESVGIPFIVMDPSAAGMEGTVIDDPICAEDMFPTFLGLAGVKSRDKTPGIDLTPLIRGKVDKLDREGVLLEFVSEIRPSKNYTKKTWRGFRTKRYKYTVLGDLNGGEPWQFFDLDEDPCELQNLIDDPGHAEQVVRHHRLLRECLVSSGDHFPLKPAFDCEGLNLY